MSEKRKRGGTYRFGGDPPAGSPGYEDEGGGDSADGDYAFGGQGSEAGRDSASADIDMQEDDVGVGSGSGSGGGGGEPASKRICSNRIAHAKRSRALARQRVGLSHPPGAAEGAEEGGRDIPQTDAQKRDARPTPGERKEERPRRRVATQDDANDQLENDKHGYIYPAIPMDERMAVRDIAERMNENPAHEKTHCYGCRYNLDKYAANTSTMTTFQTLYIQGRRDSSWDVLAVTLHEYFKTYVIAVANRHRANQSRPGNELPDLEPWGVWSIYCHFMYHVKSDREAFRLRSIGNYSEILRIHEDNQLVRVHADSGDGDQDRRVAKKDADQLKSITDHLMKLHNETRSAAAAQGAAAIDMDALVAEQIALDRVMAVRNFSVDDVREYRRGPFGGIAALNR
jgi:hypothetical protein